MIRERKLLPFFVFTDMPVSPGVYHRRKHRTVLRKEVLFTGWDSERYALERMGNGMFSLGTRGGPRREMVCGC